MSTKNRQLENSGRWLRVAAASVGAGCALAMLPSVALATARQVPPGNNNVAHAELLTGANATSADGTSTDDATAQSGEPRHNPIPTPGINPPPPLPLPPAHHSVWYKWRAPSSCVGNTATVETAGSDFDTVLAVYTPRIGANGVPRAILSEFTFPGGLPPAPPAASIGNYNDTLGDNVSATVQTSRVTFTVRQPRWYFIAVDGSTDADTGSVNLTAEC